MKAWGDQLDPAKETGVCSRPPRVRLKPSPDILPQIRFLGDPSAAFTKALDLDFDGSAIFGGVRGKRYALLIEDGKVKEAFVEPDNTGTNGRPSLSLSRSRSLPGIN